MFFRSTCFIRGVVTPGCVCVGLRAENGSKNLGLPENNTLGVYVMRSEKNDYCKTRARPR